jgi:hypothetical protein
MNNTSFHAEVRLRQRGILEDTAYLLMKHGEVCPAPNGAHKITLSARKVGMVIRDLKKEIHWLEKASNVVLIEKDGIILTGYKKRP